MQGFYAAPEGVTEYSGHLITVTAVSRDKQGSVTRIDTIEGQQGGDILSAELLRHGR
jgi:hypothetical protein